MYLLDTRPQATAPSMFHENSSTYCQAKHPSYFAGIWNRLKKTIRHAFFSDCFCKKSETQPSTAREPRDDAKYGKVHPLQESDPTAGQATLPFSVLAMGITAAKLREQCMTRCKQADGRPK